MSKWPASQELKREQGNLGGNEGGGQQLIAESGGLFLDFGEDGFLYFELIGGRVGFAVLSRLVLIRLFQQTTSRSVRGASPGVSKNLARLSVAVLHRRGL